MREPDQAQILHFNLLDMASPSHNNYGLWRLPENQKRRFRDVAFWQETARACEAALFDSLFIADVLGISAAHAGSQDLALREGIHVPELDPAVVAAAVIPATTHLGIAVTQSCTYEHPFALARRMASLDQLSGGRIGWNIVMSYHPNANENFGFDPAHLTSEERYDRAEDFMDVAYKLFEQSWEDGAVVADAEGGIYADPAKVHRIDHTGPHYRCSGPSLVDPSPQRTPLLFQAGMSDRGRKFAAKHAEVVFVLNRNDESMHAVIRDLREQAAAFGRGPSELKIVPQVNIIVGETSAEARAKLDRYQSFTRAEGYLAHEFGRGFDPFAFPRSMRVTDALEAAGQARADSGAYGRQPDLTIGELIDAAADLSNERFFVCGDAATVADKVEEWADTFGLDGFNLRNYSHPHTVRDFGEHVVPELQRRGRYRLAYEGQTLREHVFGAGRSRLAPTHPAAAYRPS